MNNNFWNDALRSGAILGLVMGLSRVFESYMLYISDMKGELPQTLTNVIKCKNPRCITSTEQEINHVFKLTDKDNGVYRCIYCETQAK